MLTVAAAASAQAPRPAPATPPSPPAPSPANPAQTNPTAPNPRPPGATPAPANTPPAGASNAPPSAAPTAPGGQSGSAPPAGAAPPATNTPDSDPGAVPAAPGEAPEGSGTSNTSPPAPGAAPPKKPPSPTAAAISDEEADLPPIVPPATDTVSGHFNLAASAGLALPFGKLEAGVSQSELFGPGVAFGVEATIGVSRSVFVGAWGQYLKLSGDSGCRGDEIAAVTANEDCGLSSFAVGPMVRYHLVQGLRFDPWLAAGVGYRKTRVDPGQIDYTGIEWLRLAVGGEWYATSNFGIGALLELNLGVYTDRSVGEIDDARAYWQLVSGLRLAFDVPGK